MDTAMENQNVVENENGGAFSNTLDYVTNNPITAAAGVAFVAGVTLLIYNKVTKPDSATVEAISDMASAVAVKGGKAATKAAKYSALMMRH